MPVASRGFFITIVAGVMIGATAGFYLKDKEEIKGLVSFLYSWYYCRIETLLNELNADTTTLPLY